MESRKSKLLTVILFTLEAYKASAFYVGQPYSDVVVPIPEVSVTIGGTMQAFPVQREEIVYEQTTNTQILPYQNYPDYTVPYQQPQLIILDDACKGNSFDSLLLLLLLGNRGNNKGSGGNNNCCYNNCYGGNCYNGNCVYY